MAPRSEPLPGLVRTVREARFGHSLRCVHCAADDVVRWGSFSGRQRYRCRSCRRTFSDLTKTPFAYIKKTSHWPAYTGCVRRGDTLRAAADQLDVHVSTAFRWRHRLLGAVREQDPVLLEGLVELKELSFAASRKGARDVLEPRPRGLGEAGRGWRWYQLEHDRVLVARSRSGAVLSVTVGRNVTPAHAIRRLLIPRLVGRCACFGRAPRAGSFGVLRSAGHSYETVRTIRTPSELAQTHLLNVDEYARRLLVWLQRFRGVASRYRDNYLMWHRVVDPDSSHVWMRAVILSSIGVRSTIGPGFEVDVVT